MDEARPSAAPRSASSCPSAARPCGWSRASAGPSFASAGSAWCSGRRCLWIRSIPALSSVSASNSGVGQWMNESGDNRPTLSDVTPDNDWIPGADYAAKAQGHHEFPRANYRDMPPETQRVFDEANTGRLFIHSIDGRRHQFDAFHRQYNAATGELLETYMRGHGIEGRPDLMTPDHARALLSQIAESQDPRILSYRNLIRLFRLLPWLRSGGGSQ